MKGLLKEARRCKQSKKQFFFKEIYTFGQEIVFNLEILATYIILNSALFKELNLGRVPTCSLPSDFPKVNFPEKRNKPLASNRK